MWGVEICKIYSKIMKKYHHCVKFTYPLSFQTISYHILSHHITPYHIIHHTISCHTTHTIPYMIYRIKNRTIWHHILYHIYRIIYRIIWHHTPYHTTQCHVTWYHISCHLFCGKPYIIPYHTISHHIILSYHITYHIISLAPPQTMASPTHCAGNTTTFHQASDII